MASRNITFSNEEYLNFELIGINSREKDFRLAWFLNKEMKWSLERLAPYKLETKDRSSEHELFKFVSEENHYTIHLISNRSLQGVLLPEYAQLEYLLKVEGREDIENLVKEIRKINNVLAAFHLSQESLKHVSHLFFD
jgi:predicted metal-dependent hydrolase